MYYYYYEIEEMSRDYYAHSFSDQTFIFRGTWSKPITFHGHNHVGIAYQRQWLVPVYGKHSSSCLLQGPRCVMILGPWDSMPSWEIQYCCTYLPAEKLNPSYHKHSKEIIFNQRSSLRTGIQLKFGMFSFSVILNAGYPKTYVTLGERLGRNRTSC